jgi:hypothetical protein
VTLDRAVGDEQLLCDLSVREVLARKLGDATFACCQRVEAGEDDSARTRAGGSELRFGALGKPCGALALSAVQRVAEKFSRLGAPIAAPKDGAEVGEGARAFQPCVATLEGFDGLAKQEFSLLAASGDAGRSLRHAEHARSAESVRKLELRSG